MPVKRSRRSYERGGFFSEEASTLNDCLWVINEWCDFVVIEKPQSDQSEAAAVRAVNRLLVEVGGDRSAALESMQSARGVRQGDPDYPSIPPKHIVPVCSAAIEDITKSTGGTRAGSVVDQIMEMVK